MCRDDKRKMKKRWIMMGFLALLILAAGILMWMGSSGKRDRQDQPVRLVLSAEDWMKKKFCLLQVLRYRRFVNEDSPICYKSFKSFSGPGRKMFPTRRPGAVRTLKKQKFLYLCREVCYN